MPPAQPMLHLLCGKMAAGKSTLAAKLAEAPDTILISEDVWLDALFADQLTGLEDYVRCSRRLRGVMGPHIVDLLRANLSVVLDFQANTKKGRAWMRGLLEQSAAADRLHVLTPPDEVCLARLRARNASGDHPFAPTEAQFHQFSKYFEPPTSDEGFTVIRYED